METNLVVIPKPELSAFEAFVPQVAKSVKLMSYVGRVTEDKLATAQQMMTDAKALIKTVEAQVETINRPYINLKNDINAQQNVTKDRCAEVVKPLVDAIKVISDNILAFNREAQEERRKSLIALQAKLKEQSGGVYNADNNKTPVQIAVVAEAPKVKGLRKTIKYEVVDALLVSRGYCSPDDALIQAAFRAGVRNIPGLRIWEEESIR